MLAVPAQAEKESATPPAADAMLALKAVLAVPPKPPSPERPRAEAVQALKSLLLSPVQVEESPESPSEPASFQALKTMLMSGKVEDVAVEKEVKGKAKGQKRSSSPKTNTTAKAVGKVTPTRSEKKKKQKASSVGKPAFAGSMFQSSPDPNAMPMPDFDEAQSSFFADSFEEEPPHSPAAAAPIDQLSSLRMVLKIPA
jgi:hypothetical protein